MNRRARTLAAAVAAAVVASGCGTSDPVGADADRLCAELAGAGTPIERRLVEAELTDLADAGGDAFTTTLAAMVERCPDETADLLTPRAGAVLDVTVDVTGCSDEDMSGTITNDGDATVDVRLTGRFIDEAGVLLDTATDRVEGLRAGETGRFEMRYFGDGDVARCSAEADR